MSPDDVLNLMRTLLLTGGAVAGPLLAVGLGTGVVMGILQAATQIQESAVSFVPKLMALGLALLWGGPWVVGKLAVFTGRMLEQVAHLGPGGAG